jgi:hypothetical protein
MSADKNTHGTLSRRSVLNAGVAALALCGSTSAQQQQPPQQPVRARITSGPNRSTTDDEPFTKTSEPANSPIGDGKGIHPGRVAWAYQPKAVTWDGKAGNWWEDASTNSRLVDEMFSGALQFLTGERTDRAAWKALFQFYNQNRKLGSGGYRPGEKIAIKLNSNQDRPGAWRFGGGLHSPHVVYALVHQLITEGGIPGQDIILYDASRYIGDPIFNRIKANRDANFQAVRFLVNERMAGNGRTAVLPDKTHPIRFCTEGAPRAYPPECVTQVKYLINASLLRSHELMGVTATAKNHFGSVYFDGPGFTPLPIHDYGSRDLRMASYNCLTDLIAFPHFGGKTVLYMLDHLYGAASQVTGVVRYQTLGNHWPASVFMSQDPVAIDSVGLDLVRNEPAEIECRGCPENYLHEAALAGGAPSGTVYDPSQGHKPGASLGVHEHWNNASERKYSRNLGKREGIELALWPKQVRLPASA